MVRIICDQCKNAYLENTGDGYTCPSCGAVFSNEDENLLLGMQHFKEEDYETAADYLMKYLVKKPESAKALLYKALCDGFMFDEDTLSLGDVYKKIGFAFDSADDKDFADLVILTETECCRLEKLFTEAHVNSLVDADAEKIKKEVTFILKIRDEAIAFRKDLLHLSDGYNERNERKLTLYLSECYNVSYELAGEIGDKKLQKIKDDVASHTVFTGILSGDIRNLEIYYRCIVMFFKSSKAKYDFLLENAKKFASLNGALETGNYSGVASPSAAAEKLKTAAYNFFEESLKEYDDDETEHSIVEFEPLPEPVILEKPEIAEDVEVIEEPETNGESEVTEEAENQESVEIPEEVAEETPAEDVPAEETEETPANEEETVADISAEETAEVSEENSEEEIIDISSNSFAETENAVEPEAQDEKTDEIPIEPEETVIEIETEEKIDPEQVENVKLTPEAEKILEESTQEEPTTTLKPRKKKKPVGLIVLLLILVGAVAYCGITYGPNLVNGYKYNAAAKLASDGKLGEAVAAFAELGNFKDSPDLVLQYTYENAVAYSEAGNYDEAATLFQSLGEYKDSTTKVLTCKFEFAKKTLEDKNYDEAIKLFKELGDYGNSADMIKECSYQKGLALIESKSYEDAIAVLSEIKNYPEATKSLNEAKYLYVTANFKKDNKTTVKYLKELAAAKYRNSVDLKKELLGEEGSGVKLIVNTSTTDLTTALTSVSHKTPCYFHVIASDEAYYGKTATLSFTTQYGYTQKKTVTLTKKGNSAYFEYPATDVANYKVTFTFTAASGEKQSLNITIT